MSNPWFAENLDGFVREEFENLSAKRPDGALYERERQYAAGEPVDIPLVSADFTGSGTLTWTVLPKNLLTLAYSLTGMEMLFAVGLSSTTVAGAGNILQVMLPGGFLAARRVDGATGVLNDAGTLTSGTVFVSADSNVLKIARTDQANFTAGTLTVTASLRFWVKSQAI